MQDAINHIKNLLGRNISRRENINEANQYLMGLGLTMWTAAKMVKEIADEEPWYNQDSSLHNKSQTDNAMTYLNITCPITGRRNRIFVECPLAHLRQVLRYASGVDAVAIAEERYRQAVHARKLRLRAIAAKRAEKIADYLMQ